MGKVSLKLSSKAYTPYTPHAQKLSSHQDINQILRELADFAKSYKIELEDKILVLQDHIRSFDQNQILELCLGLLHVLQALKKAQTDNNIKLINDLISIVAERMTYNPSGSPGKEGSYIISKTSQKAHQHYSLPTPNLAEFLFHAPILAQVYEGKVRALCHAFPALEINNKTYLRRPETLTESIHGAENCQKFITFHEEVNLFLTRLEKLCQHPSMTQNTHLLIENIRLNILFPFEQREKRNEKLDDQPPYVFLDIKRKLEVIYTIIDNKLKSNDAAQIADLNITLNDMIIDAQECGKGFHSLLNDVIEKENIIQEGPINLERIIANSRTAAVKHLASWHITKNKIKPHLEIHVEDYFLRIAQLRKFNPVLDEARSVFVDSSFKKIFDRLPNLKLGYAHEFDKNSICASIENYHEFDNNIAHYFNEYFVINAISEELQNAIRNFHAEYLNQLKNTETSKPELAKIEITLLHNIESFLSSLKVPKKLIDSHHIIESFFAFRNDNDWKDAYKLVSKKELSEILSLYSIFILEANETITLTQTNEMESDEPNELTINTLSISVDNQNVPYPEIPGKTIFQYLTVSGKIVGAGYFFDHELYKDDEKAERILNELKTHSLLRKFSRLTEQCMDVVPEEQKNTLTSLAEEIKFSQKKLRRELNLAIVKYRNKIANKNLLRFSSFNDLQFEDFDELNDFFQSLEGSARHDELVSLLMMFPASIAMLRSALFSEDTLQHTKALNLINKLTAEIIAYKYCYKNPSYFLKYLSSVFDNVEKNIPANMIPEGLRPYLSYDVARKFINQTDSHFNQFYVKNGVFNIYQAFDITDPEIARMILVDLDTTDMTLDDKNLITDHFDEMRKNINHHFLERSHAYSDFQKGLAIFNFSDIYNMVAMAPNDLVYRKNFNPLQKLIDCKSFSEFFRHDNHNFLLTLRWMEFIAKKSQLQNPSVKIYDPIMHKIAAKLLTHVDCQKNAIVLLHSITKYFQTTPLELNRSQDQTTNLPESFWRCFVDFIIQRNDPPHLLNKASLKDIDLDPIILSLIANPVLFVQNVEHPFAQLLLKSKRINHDNLSLILSHLSIESWEILLKKLSLIARNDNLNWVIATEPDLREQGLLGFIKKNRVILGAINSPRQGNSLFQPLTYAQTLRSLIKPNGVPYRPEIIKTHLCDVFMMKLADRIRLSEAPAATLSKKGPSLK